MARRYYVLVAAGLSLCLALSAVFAALPDADPAPVGGAMRPAPKLATLGGGNRFLAKALEELADKTTETASDELGDPDPVVDLGLKQATFWETLDALAEKANARVDLHARGGVALVRRPAGWKPPPISHSGLFRSTLSSVSAKLDLESDTRTYTAAVEVAWESHLLPILLETRPHDLTVRDDANRLLPVGPAGSSLAPVDGRTSLPLEITLPPLSRSVRSLSLLEGQLDVVAPTKMLAFTFDSLDQLAKAAPDDPRLRQTQEEVVCRITRLVAAEDRWSVEVALDYPEGNAKLDSFQSWVVNNEMVLERGDERLASSSYLLEESSPRHAVLTYNFNDKEKLKSGLEGWKLIYRTPALVVKVPFSFSFKDVPLP